MNKKLFDYTKTLVMNYRHGGKVKFTPFAECLYLKYFFGKVLTIGANKYLVFSEDDRALFISRMLKDQNLDLLGKYPEKKSKVENAGLFRNEKFNSYAVSRDFMLINCLNHFCLNQQKFAKSPLTSLGTYIKADEITSIEHENIVLVENLEMMANLDKLIIPEQLQNALWVYRGDKKDAHQTSTAYQFFRHFKNSHQSIFFGDLDPKGIEMAITSHAQYWLTPENSDVVNIELHGLEQEWDNQGSSSQFLENQAALSAKCELAFTAIKTHRKTLKQEHFIAQKIKLNLFEL